MGDETQAKRGYVQKVDGKGRRWRLWQKNKSKVKKELETAERERTENKVRVEMRKRNVKRRTTCEDE